MGTRIRVFRKNERLRGKRRFCSQHTLFINSDAFARGKHDVIRMRNYNGHYANVIIRVCLPYDRRFQTVVQCTRRLSRQI